MPGRNLVLMFDGTWNARDDWTNVARMFEAVDRVKEDEVDHFYHADNDDPVQLVKYLEGVGIGWRARFLNTYFGGLFGYGLSAIVKEAYLWLSNNYTEGDQIFVFGFSRGAYSARSLVSLVHKCGGVLTLKPGDHSRTRMLLEKAYELYRGFSDNAAYDLKLKEFGAEYCQPVTVKMLGVWDTVGALGIPQSIFKINLPKNPTICKRLLSLILNPILSVLGFFAPKVWFREYYVRFHDQALPCIVDEAYHALAIDEHRQAFEPTLWESRPKATDRQGLHDKKPKEQIVEQCWFVGSHSNVGGGIDNDQDPEDLWQLSYEWMQGKAEAAGLRYKWSYNSKTTRWKWLRNVEDSYGKMLFGLYSLLHESTDREVMIREEKPSNLAESLHPSVKLRLVNNPEYRPKGLRIKGDGPGYEKAGKKYLTEIPYKALPEKTCSCKKYDHGTTPSLATKMHKKQLSHGVYSRLLDD